MAADRAPTNGGCRALLRQEGYRLPAGEAEHAVIRLDRMEVSATVTTVLAPIRAVLQQLTATLRDLDAAARTRAQADPIVRQRSHLEQGGDELSRAGRAREL
jgi:hypothetical protein